MSSPQVILPEFSNRRDCLVYIWSDLNISTDSYSILTNVNIWGVSFLFCKNNHKKHRVWLTALPIGQVLPSKASHSTLAQTDGAVPGGYIEIQINVNIWLRLRTMSMECGPSQILTQTWSPHQLCQCILPLSRQLPLRIYSYIL